MKPVFRILLAALLLLGSRSAFADTLQFIFSDSPGYPFQFKVNGANTITNLMCLDVDKRVTYNEKWNVTVGGIPTDSSASAVQYRQNAFIFSLVGSYSNADLQYAAWAVQNLDATKAQYKSDKPSSTGLSATIQSILDQALQKAKDQVLINSGFFSKFQLYLPIATDTSGWTAGTPQRYIGLASTAVTPEPSALVLMLTGVLCIACALAYRRWFAGAGAPTVA